MLQAALSLRLIWSNTVFADEGLYLWAGHVEIAHWLHGLPMPANQKAFSAYFSGAPQIYGPVGALADSAWHLTGPRLLSLAFMLATTMLLFSVANRLIGGYAGICAAALWAVSEPALKLGALATFDPMAVFLLTAAVYVIVSPRQRRRHGELVALGALLTGLASLTAYSYLIYVPVIAVIAVLVWLPWRGVKGAIISGLWMLGTSLAVFVGGATALKLWPGIISEILAREPGSSGIFSVTVTSWDWVGIVLSLALAGIVASVILKGQRTLLLAVLAASAVVVPLQNMRLETGTSLEKHISIGLWLASIACGYLLSECAKRFGAADTRKLVLLGGFLLLIPGVSGFEQAFDTFHIWPNTEQFSREFNTLAAKTPGPYLVEHPGVGLRSISEYSSPIGLDWSRWGDVSWAPTSIPTSRWIDYYAAQLSSQKFGLVAIFLPWNSESPSVSRVYFTARAQPELLRAITSDPNVPGIYALSSAIIASHKYRLAWVSSEGGRTAGTFVVWQRVSPPTRAGQGSTR